jgi:hypothetical protein
MLSEVIQHPGEGVFVTHDPTALRDANGVALVGARLGFADLAWIASIPNQSQSQYRYRSHCSCRNYCLADNQFHEMLEQVRRIQESARR